MFNVDPSVLIPRSCIGEILFNNSFWVYNRSKKNTNKSSIFHEEGENDDEEDGEVEKNENTKKNSTSLLSGNESSGNSKGDFFMDRNKVKRILDLCSGSGCLAILSAKSFPNATVIHAADISSAALKVASGNILANRLEDKISLYCGDLFDAVKLNESPMHNNNVNSNNDNADSSSSSGNENNGLGTYDLIICNPPYVDKSGMHR